MEVAIPVSKEQRRYDELDALEVGEVLPIDAKDQQSYSDTAGIFHKTKIKQFRTTRKEQPEGRAIVIRIK